MSKDRKFLFVIESDHKSWSRFHAIDIKSFSILCIYQESNLYDRVYIEKDHFLAVHSSDNLINRIEFTDLVGE